jgi:hypothetical protein
MNSARYAAFACFILAAAAFFGAIMAEFPPILASIPALIIMGLGFLAADKALELLSEIAKELKQISFDQTK